MIVWPVEIWTEEGEIAREMVVEVGVASMGEDGYSETVTVESGSSWVEGKWITFFAMAVETGKAES